MVNEVIEACRESAEGYRLAAGKVTEPNVREIFLKISHQRAQFAEQLLAAAAGSEFPRKMSHDGWDGLQSAVPVEHDLAVLDEVERAEDATVHVYEGALAKDLPGGLRTIVDEQYWEVRKDHDRIRSLRDSHWNMEVPMAGLR